MSGDLDGDLKSRKKKSGFLKDFKQQTTDVWTPRYTASGIAPWFIGFGLLLVPLGTLVLIYTSETSSELKEFKVDYTHCSNVKNQSETCAEYIRSPKHWENSNSICECEVEFVLPKPINGEKIYMYYTLENYHQNARQYASSKDDVQLLGKIGTVDKPYLPSKDCEPLRTDANGKIMFPCGAVANSMFNDTIQLYYNSDNFGQVKIAQERRGIAWAMDLKYRFKNPKEFYNRNDSIWEKFTKPRDWGRTIWDLDPEDQENNGIQNEDFVVWMRTAAFSNFNKLYRIISPSSQSEVLGNGLPSGNYVLKINYRYEVVSFSGKKGVLLSTTTIFGQRNLFQGIASVSLGGVSIILGLFFLLCGCNNSLGKGTFTKSTLHGM